MNNKYNLGFISDEDIVNHVKSTVEKYRFSINLIKFNKNIIDPIKLTFDSKVYQKSIEETIESEILRQVDKSNSNEIGYFHQNLFKYINNKDWVVPSKGFDIVNEKLAFYVEMKNKHNTMNAASSQKTYMIMQNQISKNPNSTCALVEVIAKKSQNIPWSISLDKVNISNPRIRRISIDKFYELVTGNPTAFRDLCQKLPIILDDVIKTLELPNHLNTVVKELTKISPNLLKSLYLLSFKKYEGFEKIDL